MDRLIVELKFSPQEAYIHLRGLIEQANAYWASLTQEEAVRQETKRYDLQQDGRLQPGDIPVLVCFSFIYFVYKK